MSGGGSLIDWRLLHGPESGPGTHAIYSRDRLQAMARDVLKVEAPAYQIRLFGANHPLFDEVVSFLLLARAPLSLRISAAEVEDGALWPKLYAAAKPGQLEIALPPVRQLSELPAQLVFIKEFSAWICH